MSFRFSCFCLFVKELSSGDSGGRRADFTSAVHHQELAAPPFLLTQLNSLPLLRFIGWILQRRGPVLISLTDTVLVCVRVCVFQQPPKKNHRSSPHIARRPTVLALACVQPRGRAALPRSRKQGESKPAPHSLGREFHGYCCNSSPHREYPPAV